MTWAMDTGSEVAATHSACVLAQEGEVDGVEADVRLTTPGFSAPSPICGVGGDAGGSLGALLNMFGTSPVSCS